MVQVELDVATRTMPRSVRPYRACSFHRRYGTVPDRPV